LLPELFLGVTDWDHANEASNNIARKEAIAHFTISNSD
jgi:hypothetical protein